MCMDDEREGMPRPWLCDECLQRVSSDHVFGNVSPAITERTIESLVLQLWQQVELGLVRPRRLKNSFDWTGRDGAQVECFQTWFGCCTGRMYPDMAWALHRQNVSRPLEQQTGERRGICT
jgi:hypothetical protein